jgi:hypothetical protein
MDVLTRITALLAKSEGTDNDHERDAYLTKAQQLATLHAVDLAVARATARGPAEQPERRRIVIGEYRKQANRHLIRLYSVIAHSNDVVIDVAADSTAVFAYGMPADLDTVAAMFGSIAHQMVHAGNAHVAGRSWEGELSIGADGWPAPNNARRARIHFYAGFTARIGERLAAARAQAERTAGTIVVPGTGRTPATTGAVVLASRGAQVRDFHARTSRARGRWSGNASVGYSRSTEQGQAAGSRARLGTPGSISA